MHTLHQAMHALFPGWQAVRIPVEALARCHSQESCRQQSQSSGSSAKMRHPVLGNWGGWKADADAFLRQSQSRGPQVPFRLDVAAGIHRKAQLAVLKRCVEVAFFMLQPAQV